jgi:hypothetical protein
MYTARVFKVFSSPKTQTFHFQLKLPSILVHKIDWFKHERHFSEIHTENPFSAQINITITINLVQNPK